MEVKTCKKCGSLFNYLSGPPFCQACKDEIEKQFRQVKEYIRENSGANIQEICEANDVTQKQLRQWIREERLEFAENSPVQMNCESCGKSIRTGRYCDACKNNMAANLTSAFKKPVQHTESKKTAEKDAMRFM